MSFEVFCRMFAYAVVRKRPLIIRNLMVRGLVFSTGKIWKLRFIGGCQWNEADR